MSEEAKIFNDIKQYMRFIMNYEGNLICRLNDVYDAKTNQLVAVFRKDVAANN